MGCFDFSVIMVHKHLYGGELSTDLFSGYIEGQEKR